MSACEVQRKIERINTKDERLADGDCSQITVTKGN
jgi:hypothetical protein